MCCNDDGENADKKVNSGVFSNEKTQRKLNA